MAKKKREEPEEKKTLKITLPKVNPWILSTLILVILLILSLTGKWTRTGVMAEVLSPQEAADKAVAYLNDNLVQTGSASFVSVEELDSFYEVIASYQGQQIPIHVTKDGSYMYLVSQPFDMTEELPQSQDQEAGFDAPDKERPEVDLFVMSFCPYGTQAEEAMRPVVELLGDKADIKIRFIANVQGDDVESVRSLHGIEEAKEDLRQVCVIKQYGQETFWNYLTEINENCFSIYRDSEKMDACWKEAAGKFNIDVDKIETCAYGSEGLELLKANEELTNKYSVSGSPTLIINGQRYSGARTPEAFKQGICSGFVTEPEECSQTLSESGSTVSGGCG